MHAPASSLMEMTKFFAGISDSLTAWAQEAQTTARLNIWRGFATPHAEDSRHFHSAYFQLGAPT
jgi:hypothetical protein